MININKILGNCMSKRMNRKNDKDGDGINDKKDCQPRNTMRQDVIQNPITGIWEPAIPPKQSIPHPWSGEHIKGKISDRRKDQNYYKEYIKEKI